MRPDARAIWWLLDPSQTRRQELALVRLLRGNFPWRRFSATVLEHGIAPFLYLQLRRHELIDLPPGPVAHALRARYEWAAMRNAVFERDLAEIGDQFSRRALAWRPCRQTYLLQHSFYPDRGLREFESLEIAVGKAFLPDAADALGHLGFRQAGSEWINDRTTRIRLTEDFANAPEAGTLSNAATQFRRQLNEGNLAAFLDLWVLAAHDGMPPPTLTARTVRKAIRRKRSRFGEALHNLRLRFEALFPARTEMLRRHGVQAAGLGLYTLYASRLLALRTGTPPPAKTSVEPRA